MHPLPDPLYVQNQALIWIGVLVAVVTGVINAYHSLKALWLSNANKERLDSQSTTLKTVLLNTNPAASGTQTVNAPTASTVNVSDTPAPPATGPEATPTAPDLQALKDELTAHAEALKQQISDTPLTATLMGQIKASDLAAAHEQIKHEQIKPAELANAQDTPVLPSAEAAPPVSAPAVSSDTPAPVTAAPETASGPAAEPDYPDGEGA